MVFQTIHIFLEGGEISLAKARMSAGGPLTAFSSASYRTNEHLCTFAVYKSEQGDKLVNWLVSCGG